VPVTVAESSLSVTFSFLTRRVVAYRSPRSNDAAPAMSLKALSVSRVGSSEAGVEELAIDFF
jgi:hypothetical protein